MFRESHAMFVPIVAGLTLAATLAGCAMTDPAPSPAAPERKESTVTTHARGTFDVTLGALVLHDAAVNTGLGRLSIDKTFHGDLEGTSVGEMLTAGSPIRGSAGYVAVERVTGALAGKRGSFTFQHAGTMTRGTPQLSVTVVPDSGTDELAGLTGTLSITIVGKIHEYDFAYSLPESR